MLNEASKSGSQNTFSKATFGKDKNLDTHITSSLASNHGDDLRYGSRGRTIDANQQTLTFPISSPSNMDAPTPPTMEAAQVKEIYGQLKQKSSQLNNLLDQLSNIVDIWL